MKLKIRDIRTIILLMLFTAIPASSQVLTGIVVNVLMEIQQYLKNKNYLGFRNIFLKIKVIYF